MTKIIGLIVFALVVVAQLDAAAPFAGTDTKLNEIKAWLQGVGVILMTISIMGGSVMMMWGNENKAFWVKTAIGGGFFGAAGTIASFFIG
jgi:hypothetical protein